MKNLFIFIRRVVFIAAFCCGWQISPALAGAIDNEQVSYGSVCSGNGNGADWDTIFECSGSVWQRGPYFLGTTTDTCDANHAGMMRYNSGTSTVTYCNGSGWTAFGGNGLRPVYTGVANATRVAIANSDNFYVDSSFNAYGIGAQSSGQLGNNVSSANFLSTPALVNGGYSWSKVSAGELHACGITTGNVAYCWGDNSVGEVGDNTTTQRTVPTLVNGGYSWSDIAVLGVDLANSSGNFGIAATAMYAACGITTGNAAYCWGNNAAGQLGNGNNTASLVPVLVSGGYIWSSLAKNTGTYLGHMCGITNTGAGYCWGANNVGQLGNNSTTNSNVPVLINGGYTWTQLAVSTAHSCGVTNSGAAYCWGNGGSGKLGNNAVTNSLVPVLVNGGYSWTKLAGGFIHTCGITTGGVLYCWGDNFRAEGGLGPGSWNTQYTVPTAVTVPTGISSTGWTDISLAYYSSSGVNAGAVYSWGLASNNNFGDPYYSNVLPVQSP